MNDFITNILMDDYGDICYFIIDDDYWICSINSRDINVGQYHLPKYTTRQDVKVVLINRLYE